MFMCLFVCFDYSRHDFIMHLMLGEREMTERPRLTPWLLILLTGGMLRSFTEKIPEENEVRGWEKGAKISSFRQMRPRCLRDINI